MLLNKEDEVKHLIEEIDKNELTSKSLESDKGVRKQLFEKVETYSEDFLDKLLELNTYETTGYEPSIKDSGFLIAEKGNPIEPTLNFLKERVDSTGLNPASGGHLGYIPGGSIFESALGDYMAAISNRYAGVFYASPGAVRMENTLLRWAAQLVGYPKDFGGNITSGGSLANLIAFSTARKAKNIRGADIHRTVIYVSQQSHHCIWKAIQTCGMEEAVIRNIEMDDHYRMDPKALKAQIQKDREEGLIPFILISTAGSTDVGAIDPLKSLSEICQRENLWFHVDGAYGGFFLLTDYGKERMQGIELADSVVLDPHKGLFLPYGIGMVLVKDMEHLKAANSYQANYMQDTKAHQEEVSPADLSPELSKHFRGLRMWLPLKLHGTEKFKACLNEKLGLASYFNTEVQKIGFNTLAEHDLSVVVFRYVPNGKDAEAFNSDLAKYIQEDGRIFISTTRLDGKFMLRAAILSFRTHRKEVDLLLSLLREFIERWKMESV